MKLEARYISFSCLSRLMHHLCSGKENGLKYHRKRDNTTAEIDSSDKGPSEIGTTSLQRTLVAAPC